MSQTLPERRFPATLERWEPLRELEQITERMRRMFDETLSGFGWLSQLAKRVGWSPPNRFERSPVGVDAFRPASASLLR
jgi:hypothetical protein